jgi:hypothetical protein
MPGISNEEVEGEARRLKLFEQHLPTHEPLIPTVVAP